MSLVAGARGRPPQIHSVTKPSQRAFARASVSLALPPLIRFQLGLGLHEKHAVTFDTILQC